MTPDHILPQLLIGSSPRSTSDIDSLKETSKVTAVLSFQTEEDFAYWEIDWDMMVQYYEENGIEVRRVPVRDFDPDDLRKNLSACVDALDELLEAGHTVYIHCNAGMNRSPSVAIAYLHWIKGQALDDAFEHVTQKHFCDPDFNAISLATEDRRK
ncbi:MAG: dual specificity protein phosphatase family protein [Pirellulales bacterium]|nr:dual specificity protein phosphatase family protein [Pirellulales bacterium]